MTWDVHRRRVEQEWVLLRDLAAANKTIEVLNRVSTLDCEEFRIVLYETEGLVQASDGLAIRDVHEARIRFQQFFPAVPIEAFLTTPVFHPNVNPTNGFVCLWERFRPRDTIIDTILQLQRIICLELFNSRAEHVMQTHALTWIDDPARGRALPLSHTPLLIPPSFDAQREFRLIQERPRRRRIV
jgi:hypothetical protein